MNETHLIPSHKLVAYSLPKTETDIRELLEAAISASRKYQMLVTKREQTVPLNRFEFDHLKTIILKYVIRP